jgi:hypothetical protein
MLNEDQVAFTTKYLRWIHAVELAAQRRLTESELGQLIRVAVTSGFMQQEALQHQIMAATDEFLVSLRVDEDAADNIQP